VTRPTSAIIRIRLEIKIKLSPNDDLSDAKKAKKLTSNFEVLKLYNTKRFNTFTCRRQEGVFTFADVCQCVTIPKI
jgi:hypothetical protein